MDDSQDSNSKKTAIIVGAGVAGLAAAVFLDELGYQVSLIERQNILGGRTYSIKDKKTGLLIDNGQHLMIGAYHETISFLEKMGVKHKLNILNPTTVPLLDEQQNKNIFKLNSFRPPFNLLMAMLRFGGLKLKDKIKLFNLDRELKKIKKEGLNKLSSITVKEWLNKLGQSDEAQNNFWDVLTLATLNDESKFTTADGLAAVMLNSYYAGPHDGFLIIPKVGLSELFVEPTERYLNLRGQFIARGVGLKEIKIMNNQVRSFVFDDGTEQKADLFVSALPFKQLLNVLPNTFVANHKGLKNISKMSSSPIVSIHLFFDSQVMPESFVGLSNARTHWFFNSHYNKQHNNLFHLIGVISGAYDLLDKSKKEILEIVLKDLQQINSSLSNKNLKHALVLKEREATLSSRVGINDYRPQQKVLENFYVVGDWTKTDLPATIESAVKSSRMMADQLDC
ncbi:hypothetical protein BVY03_01880 [bacterium K02(2017)]|nr:hypothetical protein BVY03_01880 [bacterium K02(2017)]